MVMETDQEMNECAKKQKIIDIQSVGVNIVATHMGDFRDGLHTPTPTSSAP